MRELVSATMTMTMTNVLAMVLNMVIVIGPELGGRGILRRTSGVNKLPSQGHFKNSLCFI